MPRIFMTRRRRRQGSWNRTARPATRTHTLPFPPISSARRAWSPLPTCVP